MNDFIVFLGPTLNHDHATNILKASYRAPAALGDLYQAAKERPLGLVLIDGEFGNKPSVMHQEILWCISQGTPVIGAASMGALRAAELNHFGMVGWGVIYEFYASGKLTDDDEVAVAHAPAEFNWLPVSLALVDLRYALSVAIKESVTTIAVAQQYIALAKKMHFGMRTVESIFDSSHSNIGEDSATAKLREWVRTRALSLKRSDAVSLLKSLSKAVSSPPVASPPMVCTASWIRAMKEIDARPKVNENV